MLNRPPLEPVLAYHKTTLADSRGIRQLPTGGKDNAPNLPFFRAQICPVNAPMRGEQPDFFRLVLHRRIAPTLIPSSDEMQRFFSHGFHLFSDGNEGMFAISPLNTERDVSPICRSKEVTFCFRTDCFVPDRR